MDKEKINEVKKKLMEINKTISGLDSAIRLPAFEILAPLYFENESKDSRDIYREKKAEHSDQSEERGSEEFYTSVSHDQPSDNVLLIAAFLYSQYGVFPITKKLINEEATKNGLTVPSRSDMSMRAAQEKGKKLFYKGGPGWQLTVHGERYVKTKYSVRKGNKPAPTGDGE